MERGYLGNQRNTAENIEDPGEGGGHEFRRHQSTQHCVCVCVCPEALITPV